MTDPGIPRLYTSFAEFERDERRRLGLPAQPILANLPAAKSTPSIAADPTPPTMVTVPRPFVRVAVPRPIARISITHLTPASMTALRADGIEEIGRAPGTSVLFVRTRKGLHMLHATWVPDRGVDDYAVRLAVNWIEGCGMPSYKVAENLGVGETTLRKALSAAGYERLAPAQREQLAHARSARKMGKRGRLVRTNKLAGANGNFS